MKGTAFSKEHVDEGVTIFIQQVKTMRRDKKNWNKEQQLKGKDTDPQRGIALKYVEHVPVSPATAFVSAGVGERCSGKLTNAPLCFRSAGLLHRRR